MRRFGVLLVLSVLLQLATPAPARAWWDWVEQLSGPGPMTGFDIEARLWCKPYAQGVDIEPLVAGGIINLCHLRMDERRQVSVDLGFRWVWDKGDPRFANGERIHLLSLQPAISWNFINNPARDFVEYGFAAGAYWFRSSEFPTFSGLIVEPLRLDFRLPTNTQNRLPWWFRPVVRYALLWFPAGFEPQQFASTPNVMEIHDRATNSVSIMMAIDIRK